MKPGSRGTRKLSLTRRVILERVPREWLPPPRCRLSAQKRLQRVGYKPVVGIDKLRQLEQARQEYEKQRQNPELTISQQQKTQILALVEDFPRLWKDPATSDRDRKRMARLILDDVTLNRNKTLITVQVRFKGGATKSLSLPMPPTA